MPRSKRRLSDLEREAGMTLYLVEMVWNDGVRTTFVVQSDKQDYAIHAAEAKALNMWDGYIVSSQAYPIPFPAAPNLPEHVLTDQSNYKVPATKEV